MWLNVETRLVVESVTLLIRSSNRDIGVQCLFSDRELDVTLQLQVSKVFF